MTYYLKDDVYIYILRFKTINISHKQPNNDRKSVRILAHKRLFYSFALLNITEGTVNGKTRSRDMAFNMTRKEIAILSYVF